MSVQPDTDRKLDRTSGRMASGGARLLIGAAVLAVIGVVLLITGASTVAGLMCIGVSLAPAIGGVALLSSGAVGHHAAQRRTFA